MSEKKEQEFMKIYLLRVCAYRLPEKKCDPYDCETAVFLDLKSAVKAGKKILKEQLTEIWKTSEFRDIVDNLDGLFEKHDPLADYIFEVEEIEPEKIKSWRVKELWDEETDEMNVSLYENPLFIHWKFDYKGNLRGRYFFGLNYKDRLPGGGLRFDGFSLLRFDPADELPEAGTQFKLGDFVVEKHNEVINRRNDQIYVVGDCPEKNGKYFRNEYMCYRIVDGCFEYIMHDHLWESEIERYEGEVPAALRWFSDFVAGRIEVSEEDEARIYRGEINFSDDISYRDIKVTKK